MGGVGWWGRIPLIRLHGGIQGRLQHTIVHRPGIDVPVTDAYGGGRAERVDLGWLLERSPYVARDYRSVDSAEMSSCGSARSMNMSSSYVDSTEVRCGLVTQDCHISSRRIHPTIEDGTTASRLWSRRAFRSGVCWQGLHARGGGLAVHDSHVSKRHIDSLMKDWVSTKHDDLSSRRSR